MGFEWNTLHGALEALFPAGTVEGSRSYDRCPLWSTTLFGAAAYLLERGGVYHRVISMAPPTAVAPSAALPPPAMVPPFSWNPPNLVVDPRLVGSCRNLGHRWFNAALEIKSAADAGDTAKLAASEAALVAVRNEIEEIWTQLVTCHTQTIVQRPAPAHSLDWWLPALKLLIIADEASADFGFESQGHLSHPFEALLRSTYLPAVYKPAIPGDDTHVVHVGQPPLFAPQLNAHVARVVPKSRTPSVGCTMRTLSHNLALVPPEGIVDFYWYRELRPFPEDREPLNILLIPFPFHIPATAFQAVGHTSSGSGETDRGWFHIDQVWLAAGTPAGTAYADHFADLVCELVDSAERDVSRVHAIVLPEFSVDWNTYVALVSRLKNRPAKPGRPGTLGQPPIDFLIAGLATDSNGRPGNYAATTTFTLNDRGRCIAATYCRSKHHRWQLTGSQIVEYALGAALDPNVLWFEANEIPKREINLTVFRRGAVFSVMICEDLARSEPCHEPLRAVGPNVVFVLLMDGPQLQTRWSARYATTLADDPGSSVLTLTSLGLIERCNGVGRHKPSRHIALWKDDSGQTVEIECPKDAQGVLLTLSGILAEECTIDGRVNKNTQTWRYRGHQPVKLPPATLSAGKFASWLSGSS